MDNCIFCKILNGEIPSVKLYENEHVIAIDDINPVSKVHSLIITKKHYQDVLSVDACDTGLLGGIQQAIQEVAAIKGIGDSGFRMITNCGGDGGQMIPHLHYHIIGGQKLGSKIV